MSEELRECPFCQSRAEHYSFNYRKHTVRCSYCLADCGEHDNPERAAFVWNTRPAEDALKTEVGRLTQALESIAQNAEFWDDEDDSLAVIYRICKRALRDNPDTEKGGDDEVR